MKNNDSGIKEFFIPRITVSKLSMKNNLTGSWRYLAPRAEMKTSPCEGACPLAIPVSSMILEIENSRPGKAAELISLETPVPSVCGRVCPHPCEESCSRKPFDGSVSIRALERIAGDAGFIKPLRIKKSSGKKIAVVGAGPAGIAAAYFLLLLGHRVTIYEARDKIGGVLRYGIPGYRLPEKTLDSALKCLISLKPEIKTGMRLGENLFYGDLKKFDLIFLGIGAKIGIPFQSGAWIKTGLDVLDQIKKGEIKNFGKRPVIIGGGNTAVDTARSLLRLGKKPIILYRREIADMPAFRGEVETAIDEGVEIITGSAAKGIIRSKNRITGVKCIKVRDRGGKNIKGALEEIPGSVFTVKADDVISAIGEAPDFSILDISISRDAGGVTVDKYGRTDMPDVYAGGDLISEPRLVVHALASGKRAAIAMDASFNGYDMKNVFTAITICGNGQSFARYLDFKDGRLPAADPENPGITQLKINYDYFENMERSHERETALKERKKSFAEVSLGLDAESARAESGRCFHCGKCTMCNNCLIFCPELSVEIKKGGARAEINYDYCKGCGICAEECPGGVLSMVREVHK